MLRQTSYRYVREHAFWPQYFGYLCVRTLYTRSVFSFNWKWTDTSATYFYACQTIRYRPVTLERGQSIIRRVIACIYLLGGILSGFLLWIVTFWIIRTRNYWIGNMRCKCIVWGVSEMLHTECVCFLKEILQWNTKPTQSRTYICVNLSACFDVKDWSLSKYFSHTLYLVP